MHLYKMFDVVMTRLLFWMHSSVYGWLILTYRNSLSVIMIINH